MGTESTSRGWPWAGIDPAAWMRNWWTTFGLAPQSLTQPILPGWTITINGINSSAPQTEVEVVQRHSYGRQLGRMADALEALIEERGEGTSSDQRFTEFTSMKQEIDEIKLDAAATRIGQLLADLAMLTAAAGPSTAGCAMHCDARSTNDAARLMAMRSIASVHIQAAPQNSAILCLRAGPVSRLSAPIQHVASRRITAPSLATSLSRAVTVQGKAAQGVVSWCGWHGMQEGQGFKSP